jgi:hypothetical protein
MYRNLTIEGNYTITLTTRDAAYELYDFTALMLKVFYEVLIIHYMPDLLDTFCIVNYMTNNYYYVYFHRI